MAKTNTFNIDLSIESIAKTNFSTNRQELTCTFVLYYSLSFATFKVYFTMCLILLIESIRINIMNKKKKKLLVLFLFTIEEKDFNNRANRSEKDHFYFSTVLNAFSFELHSCWIFSYWVAGNIKKWFTVGQRSWCCNNWLY